MPTSEQSGDQPDPQLFINLMAILETYIDKKVSADKPFLVKDGIKIIL